MFPRPRRLDSGLRRNDEIHVAVDLRREQAARTRTLQPATGPAFSSALSAQPKIMAEQGGTFGIFSRPNKGSSALSAGARSSYIHTAIRRQMAIA
ncbi:MAG: hypothetical protein KA148_12370 [Ottowia sp.]|nr:hypothetical protein [Ottowia sp.]